MIDHTKLYKIKFEFIFIAYITLNEFNFYFGKSMIYQYWKREVYISCDKTKKYLFKNLSPMGQI